MATKERIEEIKKLSECAVYQMKDHKPVEFNKDDSFNTIINNMHNAKDIEALNKAYADYINLAMIKGYSDPIIIAGITMNTEMNEKFGIDIDSVIETYLDNFSKPADVILSNPRRVEKTVTEVVKEEQKDEKPAVVTDNNYLKDMTEDQIRKLARSYDPEEKAANSLGSTFEDITYGDLLGARAAARKSAHEWVEAHPESGSPVITTNKIPAKVSKQMNNKINHIQNCLEKLKRGKSNNMVQDAEHINSVLEEVTLLLASIEPTGLTEEDISMINDTSAAIRSFKEEVATLMKTINKDPESKVDNSDCKPSHVRQTVAAHTMTPGGFNIGNFVQGATVAAGQENPVINQHHTHHAEPLPHESCGLNDQQIVEYVNKHFKLMPGVSLPAYPLYDLCNSKKLKSKMKELASKQRANDPFLTQVDINQYAFPEMMNMYNTAFTIPCKDKAHVIVILFNTNVMIDPCGCKSYNMNIFKAAYKNNNTAK